MKNNKGFTLVELLVVIAIIAVLSAIAIVNLNSARNKGNDASIKANMASLPAGGELFYDVANTYSGFCNSTSIDGVEANVNSMKGALAFYCYDVANYWAATAPLQNGAFCIDSGGFQSSTAGASTSFSANDGNCN